VACHLQYQQTPRVQSKFCLAPIVIYVNKVPGCYTTVSAVAFYDVPTTRNGRAIAVYAGK